MSPFAEPTESQWLAQLASMRDAIAGLKLDRPDGTVPEYGHDLVLQDEEVTGGSSSDDIWDIFSEAEEDNYSSDSWNEEGTSLPDANISDNAYGQVWLKSKCVTFADRKSGLNANELQDQVSALLASTMKGKLAVNWHAVFIDVSRR